MTKQDLSSLKVVRKKSKVQALIGVVKNDKDLESIRGRFQIPDEAVSRLPHSNEKACNFAHGEVSFYEAAFSYGLRLKPSTHFGYFGLSPWDKQTKIVHEFLLPFVIGNHASISPTPSSEVVAALPSSAVAPPITRSKEKDKAGKSVWEDLASAVGRAHNVIIDEELRGLSAAPSHELVSRHIHKLVQVLGELLQLTTYYLSIKEKVVVAQSKAESAEAESSPFRKDLMKAMDQAVKSKEKAYELKKTLKVEKKLA
nr:hypothetical protein CFP56_66570 [Quercus suber]